MKNLIGLLFLIAPFSSFSTYYFVSKSALASDANAGTCSALPIATIAKLQTITLVAGDVVLFERGYVWRESYTVQQNGTAISRIVFDSYGKGELPIINGADLVTTFTTFNTNVSSAALAFSTKMAWLNGVWQQPARFPNTGYLAITSASTNTGLTSSSLTQAANFWNGSSVATKPDKYLWVQGTVSAFSANHLTFNDLGAAAPIGNGFYLYGLLSVLDTVREFSNSGGRLYIWFGGLPPASQTVEASRRQFGFILTNRSNIVIQNIHFTKNWEDGVEMTNSTNVTVQYCEMDQMYKKGVQLSNVNTFTVSNNNIHDCYGKGIMGYQCYGTVNVNGNTIRKIGMNPGYGTDGEIAGQGIEFIQNPSQPAPNVHISENTLDSIAYNGINSSRGIVNMNYINNFCIYEDDGGGIYTYSINNGVGLVLTNNIIRYGIGNNDAIRVADQQLKAAGIYLDDNSHGVVAQNNTVDSVSWLPGFFHNSSNNTFTGNTFFGSGQVSAFVQQTDADGTTGSINNSLVGNIFYSTSASIRSLYNFNASNNDTTHFGTYSGNYYINPYLATPIRNEGTGGANNYTVAQWVGRDATGKTNQNSPTTVAKNIIFINNTFYNKTFTLGAGIYRTITGGMTSGAITLLPFTSQILVAP